MPYIWGGNYCRMRRKGDWRVRAIVFRVRRAVAFLILPRERMPR